MAYAHIPLVKPDEETQGVLVEGRYTRTLGGEKYIVEVVEENGLRIQRLKAKKSKER